MLRNAQFVRHLQCRIPCSDIMTPLHYPKLVSDTIFQNMFERLILSYDVFLVCC